MTVAQPADMGTDLMWHWITVDGHRHLARYELLLHSRRRPELAAELVAAEDEMRAGIAAMLQTQGCAQPASTALWFVNCIDGVVLDQLTGPNQRRMSRDDLPPVRWFSYAHRAQTLTTPDDLGTSNRRPYRLPRETLRGCAPLP